MATVERHRAGATPEATTTGPVLTPAAITVASITRIAFGLTFLWAFFDKLLGLGYATPAERAWIEGGSPTFGFLSNSATGPLADFYTSIAGAAWADWLFMAGLLGIGLAFTFGFTMRIAGVAGLILYVLMWTVALPPANNPVLDEHILGGLTMLLLGLMLAGDHWGVGKAWARVPLVQRYPVLR